MALKRGKKLINSVATIHDGISFKSRLEVNCYKLLKEAEIKFKYEPTSYEVLGSFLFEHNSFERLSNGKGDFINRGEKKVNAITYKPDFVGEGFIIETKGLRTESFNLRFKLFKKWIQNNSNKKISIYMPQNIAEIKETINLILKNKTYGNPKTN